jgi:riboflavin synthase
MFTGIITDIGTIIAVEQPGDLRLKIRTRYPLGEIALGASIACSGACLTVVNKGDAWFAVDVSGETLAKTAPGRWVMGQLLNLERPLKLGDELGGHIVTGHVDGVGQLVATTPAGGSTQLEFSAPQALAGFIATKGSITIDGVSLTVNQLTDLPNEVRFTINLIPHSAQQTTLGNLIRNDPVNLEIDVLSRYLLRLREVDNLR